MAAKYFLMYDTTLERWKAGSFKPNGDVDVVFTITQGEFRDRWQELNGVELLTLRFVTSNAEIPPFKDIPITEIASDLIGTLYASKSDFEIATKDFFDSNVEETTLTNGSQKTQVIDQNGRPLYNPDHVDCTSTINVVYRGFNTDQGPLLINKIDMTDTTNITRTWGIGTWEGRASISYS